MIGRAACFRVTTLALAGGLAGVIALPTAAQQISVTAGEHADFTRIVLQSRDAFAARVVEDGADLRIEGIGRPIRLDAARLFQRIPRTRLSDARLDGDVLVLTRPCACPAQALTVGPGVLAIDLRDGPPLAPLPLEPPLVVTGPPADPARDAGLALALRLATRTQADDPAPTAAAPIMADQLLSSLSAHLAAAQTRGIVRPTAPGPEPRAMAPPVALPMLAELGPHLRLRDPETPATPEPEPDPRAPVCPGSEPYAFLGAEPDPDFAARLSTLRAAQFGEFDQPDAAAVVGLVEHYLAWGLGTEARSVLDTAEVEVAGAELLGGLADLLDDVASNRRARLAAHVGCDGVVGLVALLAGGDEGAGIADAEGVVAAFQNLPASLRVALGPDLVRRLIAARQIDAARIAIEALDRAAPPGDDTAELLAIEIERARGALEVASAQAASLPRDALEGQRLVLELALDRGEALGADQLEDAIVLAEAQRSLEAGRAIADLVIRHHALGQRPGQGLALLDQFALWLDRTPSAEARIAGLRRLLWTAALDLPDAAFLSLLLARTDWRTGLDDAALRGAIDARLASLGLDRVAAAPVPAQVDSGARPVQSNTPATVLDTGRPAGPGSGGPEAAGRAALPVVPAREPDPAVATPPPLVEQTAADQLAARPTLAAPAEAPDAPLPTQVAIAAPETVATAPLPMAAPENLEPPDALEEALRALSASRSLRTDLQALGLSVP